MPNSWFSRIAIALSVAFFLAAPGISQTNSIRSHRSRHALDPSATGAHATHQGKAVLVREPIAPVTSVARYIRFQDPKEDGADALRGRDASSQVTDATTESLWGTPATHAFGASVEALSPSFETPYRLQLAYPRLRVPEITAVGRFPAMGLMWGIESSTAGSFGSIWQWHDHPDASAKALFLEFDRQVIGLAFPSDFESTGVLYVATSSKKLRDGGRTLEVLQYRVDTSPPFRLKTDRPLEVARGSTRSGRTDVLTAASNGTILVDVGEAGTLAAASVAVRVQELPKSVWNLIPIFDSLTGEVRQRSAASPPATPSTPTDSQQPQEMQPAWKAVRVPPRLMLRDLTGATPDRSIQGTWNKQSTISGIQVEAGRFGLPYASLLLADTSTGGIWAAPLNASDGPAKLIASTSLKLSAFGSDSNGQPILIDSTGRMFHLVKNSPSPTWRMPERLSETGWFASIDAGTLNEPFIRYAAGKSLEGHADEHESWIGLPRGETIDASNTKQWQFPDGAVLLQTLFRKLPRGAKQELQRIETRVQLKQDLDWYAYSYRWNDDQTDATLVPAEGTPPVVIAGGVNDEPIVTWQFPSRSQCRSCHTPNATGYCISFQPDRFQSDSRSAASRLLVSEEQLRQRGILGVGSIRIGALDTLKRRSAGGTLVTDVDRMARKGNLLTGMDAEWFKKSFLQEYLEPWFKVSPTPSGFLVASFDAQWNPKPNQPTTIASQSELLQLFSEGANLTGQEKYKTAARSAADFLLKSFYDAEHGGFFEAVDATGTPTDRRKTLSGQAKAILGLVAAARATGKTQYLAAALKAWTLTKSKFIRAADGWSTSANEDFSQFEGSSQTALMHCFEALLAMYEATNSNVLETDSTALADFILERLWREPGYVAEEYDAGWSNPIPFDGTRMIEPGHLAKWSYLFSEAVRLGLPRRYLISGQQLFDYIQTYASEEATSTTIDPTSLQVQGVWQQAEYLRMLIRYADLHSRGMVWPTASRSQQWIKRQGLESNGTGWIELRSTDKGDSQRSMIHPLGMYLEGMRFESEQASLSTVETK